jgi:hypothetical protein
VVADCSILRRLRRRAGGGCAAGKSAGLLDAREYRILGCYPRYVSAGFMARRVSVVIANCRKRRNGHLSILNLDTVDNCLKSRILIRKSRLHRSTVGPKIRPRLESITESRCMVGSGHATF